MKIFSLAFTTLLAMAAAPAVAAAATPERQLHNDDDHISLKVHAKFNFEMPLKKDKEGLSKAQINFILNSFMESYNEIHDPQEEHIDSVELIEMTDKTEHDDNDSLIPLPMALAVSSLRGSNDDYYLPPPPEYYTKHYWNFDIYNTYWGCVLCYEGDSLTERLTRGGAGILKSVADWEDAFCAKLRDFEEPFKRVEKCKIHVDRASMTELLGVAVRSD